MDALTGTILAHLAGGIILSGDLTQASPATITNLMGEELEVFLSGGEITVENATVLEGDIPALNGVIHVIDSVIQ